ncbi:MAG TPA: AAA family ATPase [Intrasporangium sp.]|nr:AAA family ATPase [Intrasporangium sp.]
MTSSSALERSLQELAEVAKEAGVDPAAARDEGLRVAAALAESAPGAPSEWIEAARPGTTELREINSAFFDAAVRGRRWRAYPTTLLTELAAAGSPSAAPYAKALTGVAAAACTLGEPSVTVTANAAAASAAYLSAVRQPRHAPTPPSPSPAPLSASPLSPSFPAEEVLRQQQLLSEYLRGGRGLGPVPSLLSPDEALRQADPQPQHLKPEEKVEEKAEEAPVPAEPAEPEQSVEELLAELDAMIGLDRVKKEVHRQVALLTVERMRIEAGLKQTRLSRHLIFVGNPGTGKTTVARLIGAIYRALELLPQGQLVEVDRSELVAGYVGQTAIKTAEVCAKAVGGVLFIDEAYSLTGDQYAQEAVNTLVKEMEDHREDLVLIVAGYPDPMVEFIASNPGLASRFTTTIEFDDYTDDELLAILTSIAAAADYELTEDAERRVRHLLEASPRGPAFGNGRFARNLFEAAVGRHAWRLKDAEQPTVEELRLLTAADFTETPDPDPEAQPGSEAQEPFRGTPDGDGPSETAGSDPTPVKEAEE